MDAIRAQLEEREYDRMTMDVRRQELTENERGEMVSFSSSLGEGLSLTLFLSLTPPPLTAKPKNPIILNPKPRCCVSPKPSTGEC
jgi:hypothetical protein